MLAPAERHLLLSNLVALTGEEQAELRELTQSLSRDGTWNAWFELAELNRCEPLAYLRLTALGIACPAAVEARLREKFERIRAQNRDRLAAARPLFERCKAAGLTLLVLKGNHFGPTLYGEVGYKKMNDIDFLARAQDMPRLLELFREVGLRTIPGLLGAKADPAAGFAPRRTHHLPPYFTPDYKCVLGTHWNLASPLARYAIDIDAIWSRSVPFAFLDGTVACRALSPRDAIHHLALHLPRYKTGLKELADLLNLLRAHPAEWTAPAFVDDVLTAGTHDPVYHALSLCHALDPRPGLSDVLARLRPRVSAESAGEVARKTAQPGRILRSRSTQVSRIESSYALFTLTRSPFEKTVLLARMWRHFLWAPWDEARRIQYLADDVPRWLRPLYRLRAAAFLNRVFVHDLGPKLHYLLLLSHEVVLAKSWLEWLVLGLALHPLSPMSRFPGIDRRIQSEMGTTPKVFMAMAGQLE
jgi:hypothetical protein